MIQIGEKEASSDKKERMLLTTLWIACGIQMITACMSKSESRFAGEEESERRTIFFKRFPYA